MRFLPVLLLTACAGIQPNVDGACGVWRGGDWMDRLAKSPLTQAQVEEAVKRAIDAASLTTDIKLGDQTENCRSLMDVQVLTTADRSFEFWGQTMSGFTSCPLKYIVVGTPESGDFVRHSALVHEFVHVMQHCNSTRPIDPGMDEHHANWSRDGVYQAIDIVRSNP